MGFTLDIGMLYLSYHFHHDDDNVIIKTEQAHKGGRRFAIG
jgi:hypothetical protein